MNKSNQPIVKNPCQQSWENMIPDATGRFCQTCQLSVIDFTGKTPEEIRTYLISRHHQKVCGYFNTRDVEVPAHNASAYTFLNSFKIFKYMSAMIVAVLIITGCKTKKHTKTMGDTRFVDEAYDKTESVK